jgi:hypothetical protein
MTVRKKRVSTATGKPKPANDSFESVAKRIGCDPDLKAFDTKLKKIAKAKTK